MSIPDYQSIMLPLMKITEDHQEHKFRDLHDELAEYFNLTEEEIRQLLPSGNKRIFYDRVGWALTYLKKAELLESTGRGKYCITERGLEVLKSNPEKINAKYLATFPEFREFNPSVVPIKDKKETVTAIDSEETPAEILEVTYLKIREGLAQEILEKILCCSPEFFERLVVDLLVSMGYGGSRLDAGQAIGKSGDEGIDGIIKEDKLGLDTVYIQAKRWESSVGRPEVQKFAGALMGKKANKGVIITTSSFTKGAREYAKTIAQKIVLIDGKQLAEYMIDFGVGVSDVANYIVKKVDLDYFED